MRWIAAASMLMIAHGGASAEVQALYVMPMSNGLDQFVASRLAASGTVTVVADPRKADAVLTDRIGGHFEQTFRDLFAVKASDSAKASDAKASDKDKQDTGEFAHSGMQPLTTGRGAIFLVDRATRNVVWSTFELPKNSTPEELNRSAQRIADRLSKPQKGKQ